VGAGQQGTQQDRMAPASNNSHDRISFTAHPFRTHFA